MKCVSCRFLAEMSDDLHSTRLYSISFKVGKITSVFFFFFGLACAFICFSLLFSSIFDKKKVFPCYHF